MHQNLDQLEDLDVNMYVISGDTPEQQLFLYEALKEEYGESLPFVSDPDLKMTDLFYMKNGDVAKRGYGLLNENGKVVFGTANDRWGEQLDQTIKEIKEEYETIQ